MAPVPGRGTGDITEAAGQGHYILPFPSSSAASAVLTLAAPPWVWLGTGIASKCLPWPCPRRAASPGDWGRGRGAVWRAGTTRTLGLLTLPIPHRTSGQMWSSAVPVLVLPPAPRKGCFSSPPHPPQATPRLRCHPLAQLLWSQPASLLPKQASCSLLDCPQLQPQRLTPQPLATTTQLWATAPCTSWIPSISF